MKAIFLDIDGTLLYKTEGPFPGDIEAIEEARQRGHRFFLCTGRALANVPLNLRNAPWVAGIVAGTGTHGMLRGEAPGCWTTVFLHLLPEEVKRIAIETFVSEGRWCALEGVEKILCVNREPPKILIEEPLYLTRENGYLSWGRDFQICKLTAGGPVSPGEEAALGQFFQFFQLGHYHEAVPRGCSKSRGMETVLQALGIPREDSLAIGDGANDVDMIRFAGTGIAMGNAEEALKEAADGVTRSVQEGGVAQAVREYLP